MTAESDPVAEIAQALVRLRGRRPAQAARGGAAGAACERSDGEHPGHDRWGGPARMRAIDALMRAGTPLSVSELAESIGVDQPRASRIVAQGIESGMLERASDPADARRSLVAVTAAGVEVAARAGQARRDAVAAALEELSVPERAELARLLGRFADAWHRPR